MRRDTEEWIREEGRRKLAGGNLTYEMGRGKGKEIKGGK